MDFWTTNPYTKENIKHWTYQSNSEALQKIAEAAEFQRSWRLCDSEHRFVDLMSVADKLEARKEECAKLITLEMGKPISQSRAEIEKCILTLRSVRDVFVGQLNEKQIQAHYENTKLVAEPYGLILTIQPWNFPFWQVVRMACGALMAGNLILLKHSDITAACAELIEDLFHVGGRRLVTNLRVSHKTVEFLMMTREFEMVTFTGSTEGGRRVAAMAGASIKKTVLELGGSDAYILDESCDADIAVEKAVQSRLINSGQSCIAGKRFYVHESQYESVIEKFAARLRHKKQENPLLEDSEIGPLAHSRFVEKLAQQIESAVKRGANWIETHSENTKCGFSKAGILGFADQLRAFEDVEFFGPIALFYSYSGIDDVIDALNAGPFALGAGLFTQNKAVAEKVAASLKVGTFVVNDFVKSDVRVPFGGMRESGYGAELGAIGINEFVIWRSINFNGVLR